METGFGKASAIVFGIAAIVCFVVSILHATYLLLFMPAIVERLPEAMSPTNESAARWHVNVPFCPGWQVGRYVVNQSRFLVLRCGNHAFRCFLHRHGVVSDDIGSAPGLAGSPPARGGVDAIETEMRG